MASSRTSRRRLGPRSLWRLVKRWLLPFAGLYTLAEIAFLLVASLTQYRPYVEIFFWSWFGAISISIITIGSDMMKDTFDPRHINKYMYRIPVAPLVAFVLIFFVSLFGISVSGGGSGTTLH